MDRLKRKFATAAGLVPRAIVSGPGNRPAGIIAVGSSDSAVEEALDLLAEQGIELDYLRPRGFPFGEEVERFLASHELIYVVEQNRDAQLRALLTLETKVDKEKLRSILHYDGLSLPASVIVEGVLAERALPERRAKVSG